MLKPIKGNPGRFLDTATGQVLNIAEYREDDKYDSIYLPGTLLQTTIPFGAQYIFFRDITGKRPIDCNFTQQSRLSAGEEMVIDRLGLYLRRTISTGYVDPRLIPPVQAEICTAEDIVRVAENGFFRVEVNQILLSEGPAFKYACGYGLGGVPSGVSVDGQTVGIGVPSTAAAAKLVKTQVLTNKYEVVGYLIFHNHDWIMDEPNFPTGIDEIDPIALSTVSGMIVTAFLHGLIKSAVNK